MKLLLDTHIWIWCLGEEGKLHRSVARAIQNTRNTLWLSPLSVHEASILSERGRVIVGTGDSEWLERALQQLAVNEAPVSLQVARAAREFWPGLRDPVDALLAGTAKVLDLTLVTADERLLGIKGISILPNR